MKRRTFLKVAAGAAAGGCAMTFERVLAESKPGRSKVFLACKTKKRDREGVRQELENSLRSLKTDHFDLYQIHHQVTVPEVKQSLGTGGALEAFLKAKEEGKIQWWYRSTEEQEDVTLSLRFAWSQPGVAAGIPPSFLDLLEKAIAAAKDDRPVIAADLTRLQELAAGGASIFTRDEERAATASLHPHTAHPDHPHDGDCPYAMC